MSVTVSNPYSGKDEETCSVSLGAQQAFAGGVSGKQTEAQYSKSKLLGEWGVITAKLKKGEIPNGTKVLAYTDAKGGTLRGYLYVKDGQLWNKVYDADSLLATKVAIPGKGEQLIHAETWDVSIPQSVAPKPKPIALPFTHADVDNLNVFTIGDAEVLTVNAAGDYIKYDLETDSFVLWSKGTVSDAYVETATSPSLKKLMGDGQWFKPDEKDGTPNATPALTTPTTKVDTPIAAPTPSSPVDAGSASAGSMSHEDVAAMFVKIKDDLAKEKGLNIKGANPELDQVVFKAIGDKTGYTAAEVKAKIDAYKADGNKLSALKKKVLAGTKKVPDPKPNGVPTVATPKVTATIKEEVEKVAEAAPAKVYSDEDIAAQYIMRKDEIVGGSNGKWTLYTKSDELELEIAIQIGLKTGLNPMQQKQALANYLGSGKKLSVLKKQLIKQGAFEPKADTLKKSGADKTAADKAKDVDAKADAGYTPTSTPATAAKDTAGMPVDTGKPAPKRVVAEDAANGDISQFSDVLKADVYKEFKAFGSESYLSSSEGSVYNAIAGVQLELKNFNKDLTLLQILRIIDEQGAKKFGKENEKLFEKKVATWLTSPAGTAHIKHAEVIIAEKAAKIKAAAEAAKAAKLLEANQPPLPADSANYRHFSESEVMDMHRAMQEARPWTAGQRSALRTYTGSSYTRMNTHLRQGGKVETDSTIKQAQEGMRPSTEPMLVHRGTGISQFGLDSESLLWGLTGKTLEDKGFMSTSFGGRAAFGGKVLLEIEAPRGTQMAVAKPISNFSSENEVILAAGTKYKVLRVSTEDGGWNGKRYVVRVRVVQ